MESMEAQSPAFQSPSRSRFTFHIVFFSEVYESQKPLFCGLIIHLSVSNCISTSPWTVPYSKWYFSNFQLLKRTISDSEIEILKIDAQETVVELLGVLGRRPWLPIVVCCSSRDELDAVCSSLSTLPYISFAALVLLSSSPFSAFTCQPLDFFGWY